MGWLCSWRARFFLCMSELAAKEKKAIRMNHNRFLIILENILKKYKGKEIWNIVYCIDATWLYYYFLKQIIFCISL